MHWRQVVPVIAILLIPGGSIARQYVYPELRDIFFGEILYHYKLDDYFEAIVKLDTELGQFKELDEPGLDPFSYHYGQAEFAVGDIELSYRMFQRAGRAIKTVLGSNVDRETRNDAAYRLARLYFNREQPVNALHALELIEGDIPESIKPDEGLLSAQVFISLGRFNEAAELLEALKSESSVSAYARYNRAIALMGDGKDKDALKEMEEVGLMDSDTRDGLALQDKANLTLGYHALENNRPDTAGRFFARCRLDGPFSNRSLLGAGWSEASQGRFDRALVAWQILHDRSVTDESVQESMMAVPYAYSKLSLHGKAAIEYGHAMDVFGNEVDKLEASIRSIREGVFLDALLNKKGIQDENWFVNLREMPDTPETRYLLVLMASHDFQEAYKNYKDLGSLRETISQWLSSLEVYEEMIGIRREYYEPILPVIDEQFKRVDSRMKLRLEQRDRLSDRIQAMLISRRPEYLATSNERAIQDRLSELELVTEKQHGEYADNAASRINRLKGILNYRLAAEYDDRLTVAYKNLLDLDEYIAELNRVYQSFVRTRQAATQSYEGYEGQINGLRVELLEAQRGLEGIMARQGMQIEEMAVNELVRRRDKLEDYQIKARFALAENYDRATKARQKKAEEEARKHADEQARAMDKKDSMEQPEGVAIPGGGSIPEAAVEDKQGNEPVTEPVPATGPFEDRSEDEQKDTENKVNMEDGR